MASQLVTIRDMVAAKIEADRVLGNVYPYNDFKVFSKLLTPEKSVHIPLVKADTPELAAGVVHVIGNLNDDGEIETRGQSAVSKRDIMIQVGLQRAGIIPTNNDALDLMIEVEEKLRDTVRKLNGSAEIEAANTSLGTKIRIRRIEAMKDNEGVPYHYFMAREVNVFESYFTAIFQTVLS